VESFSATAAAGVLIHQLPSAGTNVEPGEPVVLAVSKGPAPSQVRMPRLAGLSEDDASALLKVVGLQGIAYRSYNSSIGAGEIVTQTPGPKMQLPLDSPVQFWVSQGPGSASITIPNVNGLARKEAQKRLKSRGLNVEVRTIASTTVSKGKVISQMPPSGARAATGGTVGLLVSNGNVSNGSTPDLLGKPSLEADGIAKDAGFSPVLIEVATGEHPAGKVFGQFPESNTLWPLRSPLVGVVAKSP
jgi:serine/threonine-protein kinase